MKKEIYELIKKEIDEQYRWLMDTKRSLYDIDIAFSAIKHIINKYIEFFEEPCEDCISRAEAKRIVDYYIQFYDGQFRINESIDNLPSVQPKPKTGHWILKPWILKPWILKPSNKEQGERDFIWWKCSECGQIIYSETEYDIREYHAYCSMCGAKMESEEV